MKYYRIITWNDFCSDNEPYYVQLDETIEVSIDEIANAIAQDWASAYAELFLEEDKLQTSINSVRYKYEEIIFTQVTDKNYPYGLENL